MFGARAWGKLDAAQCQAVGLARLATAPDFGAEVLQGPLQRQAQRWRQQPARSGGIGEGFGLAAPALG